MNRPRIGELLVEANVLTREQLEHALEVQRRDGRKLGHVLIVLRLVTETQLTQTLSRQLAVPWVSLYHVDFARSLLNLVPRELAEKYNLVPIFVRHVRKQGDTLYVAMDDPTNEAALQELSRAAGMPVRPMIACPTDVRNAIRVYYGPTDVPPQAPPPPAAPPTTEADAVQANEQTVPDMTVPDVTQSAAFDAAEPPSNRPDLAPTPPAPEVTGRRSDRGERRSRPKLMSLTLLDGTTVKLPASRGRRGGGAPEDTSDQLTARDLIDALRAAAQGVDVRPVLGEPRRWETMFAALLSLLLRKGLIADWEFVEELRKM